MATTPPGASGEFAPVQSLSDHPTIELCCLIWATQGNAEGATEYEDEVLALLPDYGGEVVARRGNERERTGDPTAHAEVLALRDAAAAVGDRRLREATLVVTLEPCPMCAGAAWAAQVGRIVFGAADPRAGATGSLYNVAVDVRLNHTSEVTPGVRADEAAALLTEFFASRR